MAYSRVVSGILVLVLIGGTAALTRLSASPLAHISRNATTTEPAPAHFATRTLQYEENATSAPADAASFLPSYIDRVTNFFAPYEKDTRNDPLYAYGNALGTQLQAFAGAHPDMIEVLKRHAESRSDAASKEVRQLADDYTVFSTAIRAIQAPEGVRAQNEALAEGYTVLAEKLRVVAAAKSDADFLAAIEAENKSADSLVESLVALVTIFKLNGVTFAPSDPGAVFMQGM